MPESGTHNTSTVALALCVGVGVYVMTGSVSASGIVTTGTLAGILFTPDHDLDAGNNTMGLVRGGCGKFPATLWRVYWFPYAKLFKHRGVSHLPIIGTLTRLLYFIPVNPLLWWLLWPKALQHYLWVVVGLMLADTLHFSLDGLDKLLGGRLR